MGHYDEQYEALEQERAKEAAASLAARKTKFPKDPSQWGITLAERVKLLEERMSKLEGRRRFSE